MTDKAGLCSLVIIWCNNEKSVSTQLLGTPGGVCGHSSIVASCAGNNFNSAVYTIDAEFDQIVADMISQAEEYGYAECVAFQENEAKLRAAAEDAVK